MIDAHQIVPRLWQGSNPPQGLALRQLGFDVLVLCAAEHQYQSRAYPGLRVIRAPLWDDSWPDKPRAFAAGKAVAMALRRGQRVLVVCNMGRNRSGLVSALALWYLTDQPGVDCMWQVQSSRPRALGNPAFALLLYHLPPRVV